MKEKISNKHVDSAVPSVTNLPNELREELLRQRGVNIEQCHAEGVDINDIFEFLASQIDINEIPNLEPIQDDRTDFIHFITKIQTGELK